MPPEMYCLICEESQEYFFSKEYCDVGFELSPDLLIVDYYKCPACGFTASKTHREMSKHDWEVLNERFHRIQNTHRVANQPPYSEQAMAIKMLAMSGVISTDSFLDYAAGVGTLAKLLAKYFGEHIELFDPYVSDPDAGIRYVSSEKLCTYQCVANSAMFEHVLTRQDLDNVNKLVAANGVLMLHTLVCENIPKDPNWFYLEPIVHTAFHTNKSMQLLMEQWGYGGSIYSPKAKSWFLIKKSHPLFDKLDEIVEGLNVENQNSDLIFKPGFVDYWKGF